MDGEIKMDTCPYCGHDEFGQGVQWSYGGISRSRLGLSESLYHIICLNCGSVVRSFVKSPKRFEGTL